MHLLRSYFLTACAVSFLAACNSDNNTTTMTPDGGAGSGGTVSVTLDTSFSDDGIALLNTGNAARSMVIDSNGNILVAGNGGSLTNLEMLVMRLDDTGVLDTTFGTNGVVTHDGAAGGTDEQEYGETIALDSNGKIVVAGTSSDASSGLDMAIWRLNSDGSMDTGFDLDGVVTHAIGTGSDRGYGLAIDSTDRIIVVGRTKNTSRDLAVWRFNSDGSLDTTFNTTGHASDTSSVGSALDLVLDSSGNIMVSGYVDDGSSFNMAVWRFTAAGVLDTEFDSDGIYTHDAAAGFSGTDGGFAIAIDTNSRLVIAGVSNNGTDTDFAVWRTE